jgi:hypothetical protein
VVLYVFCCFFDIFFIAFFPSLKIKPEREINIIPIGSLIHNGAGFLGIGHRLPARFPHKAINMPPIRNRIDTIKAAIISMTKSKRGEQIGRLRNAMNFGLAISQETFLLIVSFDSIVINYFAHNEKGEAAGTHPKMKQNYSRSPQSACWGIWKARLYMVARFSIDDQREGLVMLVVIINSQGIIPRKVKCERSRRIESKSNYRQTDNLVNPVCPPFGMFY